MSNRWERMAPLTGVVFVILLVVSVFLPGSIPNSDATGAKVISYADAHKGSLTTSSVIIGFSLFFGLMFYGQLRGFLRRSPAVEQLAAISFGGAVLFAAGGGVVAGAQLALGDSPTKMDPAAAQALNVLARDLPMILFVGGGVLLFAAGLAIIKSRSLPAWLGWAGIVLGVVAVLPLGFIAVIGVALWTLATSIVLTLHTDTTEAEAEASS